MAKPHEKHIWHFPSRRSGVDFDEGSLERFQDRLQISRFIVEEANNNLGAADFAQSVQQTAGTDLGIYMLGDSFGACVRDGVQVGVDDWWNDAL